MKTRSTVLNGRPHVENLHGCLDERNAAWTGVAALVVLSAFSCLAKGYEELPKGALAYGFTKCIIDERPTLRDVCLKQEGVAKWYNAQCYMKPRPADRYAETNGVLVLRLGGDLTSAPKMWEDREDAVLPFLPGADGFYVEYEYAVSSNDPDVFPAVWLMPVENIVNGPGTNKGDPAGLSRWFEIDVDEAGFGPGFCGTVHSWARNKGEVLHLMQNTNGAEKSPLDRTVFHRYGCAFDPRTLMVTWWLDDRYLHKALPPDVSPLAALQNYYLILSAQTHGKNVPYDMRVRRVRAFVAPSSAVGPTPKWKSPRPAELGGRCRIKAAWALNADGSRDRSGVTDADGYSFDVAFTPLRPKTEAAIVVHPELEYGRDYVMHLENAGRNIDGFSLVILSAGDPGNFWKGKGLGSIDWLGKGESKSVIVRVTEDEPFIMLRVPAATNPGAPLRLCGWIVPQ